MISERESKMGKMEKLVVFLIVAAVAIAVNLVVLSQASGETEAEQPQPRIPLSSVSDLPEPPHPAEEHPQEPQDGAGGPQTEESDMDTPCEETDLQNGSEGVAEGDVYSAGYFRRMGVIEYEGWRYTWYSQRVLPGGGLDIEGRHVDPEGYVCDSQGRVVLASVDLEHDTEVAIPFGSGIGIVLDSGCPGGTLDVYTDW